MVQHQCYDSFMSIGQKIAELRRENGWSQKELGSKIGVHYTSIGRWEKDGSLLDINDVIKLAKAFSVSTDYLLFDNVPRSGKVHITDLELLKQFEELQELSAEDLKAIKKVLDGYLLRSKLSQKFTQEKESFGEKH